MEEELRKLYLEQCLSREEIAKILNMNVTQIKYYLSKYKIIRNHDNTPIGVARTCPSCNLYKEASEFYVTIKKTKNGKGLRGGSWCKACMNAQVVQRQHRYKNEAVNYKGGCCSSCGFDKYFGALEFHHLDPSEKDLEMSKFSRHPLDDEGKAELDKCILLCANCHRMIHAGLIQLKK